MTDYVEYFANYNKGETEAMNTSVIKMSLELDVVIPLLQMVDKKVVKEVDRSRISFLRYKTQIAKGIYLAITSLLRLHRFQAFSDLRYALDAVTISCFALNNPEQFQTIMMAYGDKKAGPGNHVKNHTKLSEKIFKTAKTYLQEYDRKLNDRIFELKSFTSTYGSHVFFANTDLNTDFTVENQASHVIFDIPTEDYMRRSRQSLLLIGSIIILYIQFLYRNGGKGKVVLFDMVTDLNLLQENMLVGIKSLNTTATKKG